MPLCFFRTSAVGVLLSVTVFCATAFAQNNWWEPYISTLHQYGIFDSEGVAARPDDFVNRAEFAALLARILGSDSDILESPEFSDVRQNDWFYVPVATLKKLGAIKGSEGKFYPNALVNRAEAAKMITLAFGIDAPSEAHLNFSDVDVRDWFYSYVLALYYNSVVDGSTQNLFMPDLPLTRAEAAKIISLTLTVADSFDGEWVRFTDGGSAFARTNVTVLLQENAFLKKLQNPNPANILTFDEFFGINQMTESALPTLAIILADDLMPTVIPNNAFNFPFAIFRLQNDSNEDISVDSITITRKGLGEASQFESLRLVAGNKQYGSDKTFNSQTQKATFNISRTPLIITVGTTITLQVLGDLRPTGGGFSHQLVIEKAEDIVAHGAESEKIVQITGDINQIGPLATTVATSTGVLQYSVFDPDGATARTYGLGATNQLFTRLVLEAQGSDIQVMSITFTNQGSAKEGEVVNLKLRESGNKIVAGPSEMSGRNITLYFGDNYIIKQGESTGFELVGDIREGFDHTVGFDISDNFNVHANDASYATPARVKRSDGSGTIVPDKIH